MDKDFSIQIQQLKSRLLKLPIRVWSKMELWLVYRGLKPATELFVNETVFDRESKTLRVADKDLNLVTTFLLDAGLHYRIIERFISGSRKVSHKGKRVEIPVVFLKKVFLISQIGYLVNELYQTWINVTNRADPEAHLKLGKLYGFPEAAVKAYAETFGNEEKFAEIFVPTRRESKTDEYWKPYVGYKVRKGHEGEDCAVAIRWADLIRSEFPQLAAEFEKVVRS